MRATQIQGWPEPEDYSSFHEVKMLLDSHPSYTFLDKGQQAYAYRDDRNNTVIRVTTGDDCWKAWANYSIENSKTNEHLPRVMEVHDLEDGALMARVELLTELSLTFWEDGLGTALMAYIQSRNFDARRNDYDNPGEMRDSRYAELFDHPRLISAVEAGAKIVVDSGCETDMHPGNFMARGSTIILTDPGVHSDRAGWS